MSGSLFECRDEISNSLNHKSCISTRNPNSFSVNNQQDSGSHSDTHNVEQLSEFGVAFVNFGIEDVRVLLKNA
jgi:hypothetical protein